MRKLLTIFTLLILLLIIIFLTRQTKSNTAQINEKTFKIEVAYTEGEKEIGLAKYKQIDDNVGMYFPFKSSGYYSFWMKNMHFPIDIIYINKNKIVDIFRNVPSPKNNIDTLQIYKPRHVANAVLEINAGLCDKYNINIGESVKITINENSRN